MRRIVSVFVLALAMPVFGIAQQQSAVAPADHGTPQSNSASRGVSADDAAKPPAKPKKKHAPKPAPANAQPDLHGTPQGETQPK